MKPFKSLHSERENVVRKLVFRQRLRVIVYIFLNVNTYTHGDVPFHGQESLFLAVFQSLQTISCS